MRKIVKNNLGNFLVILVGIVVFGVLVPLFISAQTGNHFGEQKYLTYSIEYLNQLGVTQVSEAGIDFKPFGCCPSHQNTILPDRYFGSYPLYFTGITFHFRVIIKNDSPRTYRNLGVETFQEFLNIDGGLGRAMGENNKNVWFVEKLEPQKEIILEGEFAIPLISESGIDQTHLRISHWSNNNISKGQVILEDFQAGLWCPLN